MHNREGDASSFMSHQARMYETVGGQIGAWERTAVAS